MLKRNWFYIIRRSVIEYLNRGSSDLAAGLTYFTVLSLFPVLLALFSLLGLLGQKQESTQAILQVLQTYTPAEMATLLEGPIRQLTSSQAAGLALITGILGALWSASAYVGAFGRAVNKIYEVPEGRPFWKLKPYNLAITFLLVLVLALMLLIMVTSEQVLTFVQGLLPQLDLSTFTAYWLPLRYPLALLLLIFFISLLYYATPNVRQPSVRLLSTGAAFALAVMGLGAWGFNIYVSRFSSYNATYGLIGAFIITLLFCWIMNNALLLGVQIDAEIQRDKQLQAGIVAEEKLQLPPKDETMVVKKQEQLQDLIAQGRTIRLASQTQETEEKQEA